MCFTLTIYKASRLDISKHQNVSMGVGWVVGGWWGDGGWCVVYCWRKTLIIIFLIVSLCLCLDMKNDDISSVVKIDSGVGGVSFWNKVWECVWVVMRHLSIY